MFDSILPVSYYKEIATINEDHKVYIVQHVETCKIYVKKVLTVYNTAVFEQLFRHPVIHTPRIYAMYEKDDVLTVIEEYVSGETLQEILDMGVSFSEPEVIDYAIKLCDILSELHGQSPSIIHRDVKPSNIMLTEDSRIILLDLNAARISQDEKERDTRLLGTEGYAAPEQFGFGNSTCQTDIYAVGNLIKNLLDPDFGQAKVSSRLQSVLDKCLPINPRDRFASAEHLKKCLSKCT